MTERRQLLNAILASPGEDLPRLVYADFLDDLGERERAEFIRLQIEIEKHPMYNADASTNADWSRCISRVRDFAGGGGLSDSPEASLILKWCEAIYAGDWQHVAGDYIYAAREWASGINVTYRRGFIESISGPLSSLLIHGPAIVRENPVTEVSVTDREPFVDAGTWTARIDLNTGKQVSTESWCGWYCASVVIPPSSDRIEAEVFSLMPSQQSANYYKGFPNRADALAALNAAVLAEIQRRAKEPPAMFAIDDTSGSLVYAPASGVVESSPS